MTYKVVKRGSLLTHLTTAESCTMCNDVGAESSGHACVDIAEANQSCALRNDDFLVDSRK